MPVVALFKTRRFWAKRSTWRARNGTSSLEEMRTVLTAKFMKLARPPLLLAVLSFFGAASAACSSVQDPVVTDGGSGPGAGSSSGGSAAAGANPGGSSGAGVVGGASAGGSGGTGHAGGDAAGSSFGGAGSGGSSVGNGGGVVGGGGPSTGTAEDDGASCTVGALPEAAALVANAKLPDPFEKLDGTRIRSKTDWRCRREEIKKLAEKFAYGTKPPPPQMVTGSVSNSTISVKVSDGGKSTSFSAQVKLPSGGTAPYAAVVVYGGAGFGSPLDSAVINSEGVALVNYDPYVVGKETGARTPKAGAFYDVYGSSSTTGLLMAWGWGVSRIIDVIAQSDGKILRADAVGVTGCSRFGKGAFIAGAFDQRVALTMPVESGSAGVPIWRGIPGEGAQSLSSAYKEQPWFGDAFSAFTSAPTKAPIDTHEVIAMIAPRGLFIMDNPAIANLGPESASVAALAGAEVYEALGVGGNLTYFSDVENGSHCALRPEWSAPLRSNVRKFLNETGSDAGVIKISSKARGDLAEWRDWETPAL